MQQPLLSSAVCLELIQQVISTENAVEVFDLYGAYFQPDQMTQITSWVNENYFLGVCNIQFAPRRIECFRKIMRRNQYLQKQNRFRAVKPAYDLANC